MEYYINGTKDTERHFWNCLQGIASQLQIPRILDGHKVIIGGVEYQILFTEEG